MASTVLRVARTACVFSHSPVVSRTHTLKAAAPSCRRHLHASLSVNAKRKKGGASNSDDLFGELESDSLATLAEAELAAEAAAAEAEAARALESSVSPGEGDGAAPALTSRKRRPEDPLGDFDVFWQFVHDRTAPRAERAKSVETKRAQMRRTTWRRLLGLVRTREELERVVTLFPRWRNLGKQFEPADAELFVRKCALLNCPALALRVFADHTTYGFDLSSVHAARHLLYLLHAKPALGDAVAAASLFGVYDHPPVARDPYAGPFLLLACARAADKGGNKDAQAVARRLLGEVKASLAKDAKSGVQDSAGPPKVWQGNPDVWLARTVRRLEKKLGEQGQDVQFLKDWSARREAAVQQV